jgi:Uma2 family endonuclease
MSTIKNVEPLSVEDYLDMEEQGKERHEYMHGLTYAMVGGTARHNLITSAISSTLRTHLKEQPCTVFMSDMKVRVEEVFYYPDVMVVCKPIDPESLFQTEPVLLVEVLSKSTEAKDRLEKLVAYQSIPSVIEYILVSQDKVSIDIYRREGAGWLLESIRDGDQVNLNSVKYSATIEFFYEDVINSFK